MDPYLLEGLWASHLRLFKHIAFAIVRRADTTEEIIQEAFRRALRSRLDIDQPDEALLYLKRIVTNTSIDFYHHRRKENAQEDLAEADRVADVRTNSPIQQLLQKEEARFNHQRLRQIMQELRKLPEEQRFAIQMLVLEESPPTLTALSQSTGIPISTLRSRMILGLDRIRKALHKKGYWKVEQSCNARKST
ncbi:MAG: RNA polymerase sigma factor [Acidobacteria bacterium]|nr:RNA polymerase sigma factor [Acidobacteriota bacterium]